MNSFHIDFNALLLLLVFGAFFWLLLRPHRSQPSISYPQSSAFKPYSFYPHLPAYFKYAACTLFLIAFIDPHFEFTPQQEDPRFQPLPTEGVALYLVIDQSGSMGRQVPFTYPDQQITFSSKLDILKKVTSQFIEKRKSDLIGLVSFARTAQIHSPLTLDHKNLIDTVNGLTVIENPKHNGSAIGYALFKTANVIAATKQFASRTTAEENIPYSIKDTAIILITDGVQNPHPDDVEKKYRSMDILNAAKYIQKQGIKLYFINLDPAIHTEPFKPHKRVMEKAVEITGGQSFFANTLESLPSIFEEINRLEHSTLPLPTLTDKPPSYRIYSLYPPLLIAGLFFFALSLLFETTWLRKVPV